MSRVDLLQRGRESYAARAWAGAHEALSEADGAGGLDPADLELYGTAAYMLGRVDEFLDLLERAHHAHLDHGEPLRAVRCAFFVGVNLALRGEIGRATGWFGRARRLVEREGRECVEQGYLLMPLALQNEAAGDYAAVYATAAEAAAIGERYGDPDLFSLAVHTQGLALIRQERVADGVALLDEAMLAAAAGDLSPIVTGVVYCGVIAGCEEAFELGRAREWTDALARWCESQPELVAFGGRCRVHRAEIMQLHGAWADALEEARRGRERGERAMNADAAGQALYLQGELHRLRGDFDAAERAYRDASARGREPQPGLALLRLTRGDRAAADAAIRRALAETGEPLKRARLLPGYVEIVLAVGDEAAARTASNELGEIAGRCQSALLRAFADQARGAVELHAGDAQTALRALRRASQAWQELDAPYESARARVLVGLACRALGDEESATLELEAAAAAFERLGAAPDASGVRGMVQRDEARDGHGLTQRELEVLRLVAAGKSNREVAASLVVSEHTVARHLQNIFGKLSVSSRTAATAFAFEHDLV